MKSIKYLLFLILISNLYGEDIQLERLNEAVTQYNNGLQLEFNGKTVKGNREINESLSKIKNIVYKKTLTFPNLCSFKYSHSKLFNIIPNCEGFDTIAFFIAKEETNAIILESLEECSNGCTGEFIASGYYWSDKCDWTKIDSNICAKNRSDFPKNLVLQIKFQKITPIK